jgi:hypothetical protein
MLLAQRAEVREDEMLDERVPIAALVFLAPSVHLIQQLLKASLSLLLPRISEERLLTESRW